MFQNYWRTAFRSYARNGWISIVNLLGLSAGMTAAILLFLWVQNETSFDNYHPDANRIYRVTSHVNAAGWIWGTTPAPLATAVRSSLPQVGTTTSLVPGYNTILRVGNELIFEKNSAYVDSNWFRVFHYDVINGRIADFLTDPYSLILTRSKAQKYFGKKDPVGLFIHKDTVDYRVAAVIADNPANSSFQADIILPLRVLMLNPMRRQQLQQWGGYSFYTFVKLQPGADPAETGRLMTDILHRSKPADNKNYFTLTPLRDMHLESDVTAPLITHGSRNAVHIFTILGVFILLIACINYVNLTTARASQRGKEVGIRKLVGAAKKNLLAQFLLESAIFSSMALAFTLALVALAMPFFRELTSTHFQSPLALASTWKILGITLLAATLLNGIYPALLLSSFRPIYALKGLVILKLKDANLRKGLVIVQFTFSIILIVSAILIQRQLSYVQHADPGYDRSQVFYFSLPYTLFVNKTETEQTRLTDAMKTALLTHSSITGASMASEPIVHVTDISPGGADWEGHDTAFVPAIYQMSADPDYQHLLRLSLREGRWFAANQPTDHANFILNETAVRELTIHSPVVGQRFIFQGDTGRIIGVVKDFHFASMHEKISPLLLCDHDNTQTTLFVRSQAGQATNALNAARSIWRRYVTDRPFDYSFLDDDFNALYKTDARTSSLVFSFSLLAIIISCLGILGLAAFTAQQHTREIGIRKVLGATVTNILTLLSWKFIQLVLVSILVATPIAWWAMARWLQGFAYHIPLSPWIFAAGGALAVITAVLTILSQSFQAAARNPVKSLRSAI